MSVETTWTQRAGFYLEHLTELGYRPRLDDEDDIYFRHEGGHYYILSTDDEQYVQIVYLNFWSVAGEQELQKALLAASTANRSTKVAKVSARPDHGNMHISAEVFLARPTDLVDVFERLVGAMQLARTVFVQEFERLT